MNILLIRPFYNINVNSDMHGDLGISDCYKHVYPDYSFIMSATIISKSKSITHDIIDANAEKLLPAEVVIKLKKAYDLIIIKAAAPSIKYDIEFAKILKQKYPNANIVFGGHIAKVLKNWICKNVLEIDTIVCEPLEYYVYKLLNKVHKVKMDDLPSLDYSLVPHKFYTDFDGELQSSLYMSRGCTTGCTYCPHFAFFGKEIDNRSISKVIEDIKELKKFNIKSIEFKDQFFTLNRNLVIDFCTQLIEQKIDIKWRCQTRLESLDIELIDLMVRSGLEVIFFGVESASDETLDSFNRPKNNVEKMKRLINYINQKGVFTLAFYIIGFPEDTWDSICKTFELSIELNSKSASYFIYNPYILSDPGFSSTEIKPSFFKTFDNILTINVSKYLTIEELKFLELQLPILYKINNGNLKIAYNYLYKYQFNYMNSLIESHTRLESSNSILEI